MSQSGVHLIAFALVAVLCVCMVTSVPGATAENNRTKLDFTTSENLLSKTTEQFDSVHVNGTEDSVSKSETVNTSTQLYEGTLTTTASPDRPSPHSTNSTHGDDYSSATHNSSRNKNTESTTTESTTMESADSQSDTVGKGTGIFFLMFIFIIIIILAVILYILWKKGKRYSFDLANGEHDTPLRSMEHTGTFEQTKGFSTNLDYIQEDNPNKTNPVANGCTEEMPDLTLCSEQQNVPEEDSFTSDLSLNSPVKKVEFNLDLELIGGEPELTKQATNEPTDNDNENNNNDTNTGNDSADLFTEISLDDTQ